MSTGNWSPSPVKTGSTSGKNCVSSPKGGAKPLRCNNSELIAAIGRSSVGRCARRRRTPDSLEEAQGRVEGEEEREKQALELARLSGAEEYFRGERWQHSMD